MNLILVSGRYASPGTRHAEDAKLVRELVAAGCRVRWIVPVARDGETLSGTGLSGAGVIEVESKCPGFAAVQKRLSDGRLEHELTVQIRRELPDVVHLLDYGGSVSVNASWLAERMGARIVVSVRAASTLCHRGDLVHASGTPCEEWNDPSRCAACCLRISNTGLGVVRSTLGRFLGVVRSPLNPYPKPGDFLNRRELLLGGLQGVDRIVVASEFERDRVMSLGLRADLFEVLGDGVTADWATADWRRLYANVCAGA